MGRQAPPTLAIRNTATRCAGHKSAPRAELTVPLLETAMTNLSALPPDPVSLVAQRLLPANVPASIAPRRRDRGANNTAGHCLNGVAHFVHWMLTCHLTQPNWGEAGTPGPAFPCAALTRQWPSTMLAASWRMRTWRREPPSPRHDAGGFLVTALRGR